VRRFLLRALASVGSLAALAALDLGPRATAAYLSMESKQSDAGFDIGASAEEDGSDSLPKIDPEWVYNVQLPNPQGDLARGASLVPLPSKPSGSPLVAADLAPLKPLPSCIVVYFRAPPGSLQLSPFIDPFLDPPRVV
jgi:hypothetical protein